MILGLFFMLVIGLQSCLASVGGSIAADEGISQGGAVGIFVALLFLVGAAFAIGVPTVSLITFVVAAIFALLAGTTTPFGDLTVWGIISVVLAIMSFFGRREKRKAATKQAS